MRKSTKLVLCFALASLLFTNVNAAEQSEVCLTKPFSMPSSGNTERLNHIVSGDLKDGTVTSDLIIYNMTAYGKTYKAFCHNPGYNAAFGQYECDKTYGQIFADSNKSNIAQSAYQYGLLQIAKIAANSSSEIDKSAALIAFRSYEMLWKAFNSNGSNPNPVNTLYKILANYALYRNGEVNLNLTREIDTLLKEKGVSSIYRLNAQNILNGDGNFTGNSNNAYKEANVQIKNSAGSTADQEAIVNKSLNYVTQGLQAAKNYLTTGVANLDISSAKDVTKNEIKRETYSEDADVKAYEYSIKVDDFKSNSDINFEFECSNCSSNGVTPTLLISYDDGENYQPYTSKTNIMSNFPDGVGSLKLRLVFTAKITTGTCPMVNYNVYVNYKDDTISTIAYNLHDASGLNTSAIQSLFVIYETDGYNKEVLNKKIKMCDSCDKYKELCEAANNDSNNEYCKKYQEDCVECHAKVSNQYCSSDNNKDKEYIDYSIQEGYDSTSNVYSEDDKANILKCVVSKNSDSTPKTDDAGNDYLNETKGYIKNNKYCQTFCKEDYYFKMPGVQDTKSGRYFTLKAGIKGTKTCYTSEILDKSIVKKDLDELQKEVIDAWNNWNYYYKGLNGNYNDIPSTETQSCSSGYYDAESKKWVTTCSDSKSYIVYERKWSYEKCDIKGNCSTYYDGSNNSDGHEASCNGCTPVVTPGKIQNIVKDLESKLKTAKTRLNQAIAAYTSAINSYNACSGKGTQFYNGVNMVTGQTGWSMKYDYNDKTPELAYYYQETYMQYMDQENTMNAKTKVDDKSKQTVCNSSVSNSYECNSNDELTFETVRTFLCSPVGGSYKIVTVDGKFSVAVGTEAKEYRCGWVDIKVSNAKYVKQEMNAEGDYITKTLFHMISPTGNIVYSTKSTESGDGYIENSQDLKNGLPVGLGTQAGIYNFGIEFNELGEYNQDPGESPNDDKEDGKGRIIGDNDSVTGKNLETYKCKENQPDNEYCTNDGSIQNGIEITSNSKEASFVYPLHTASYLCAYKVNCPDCPVTCAPGTCSIEDCPDCPVDCPDCVYTNGQKNFISRQVTESDLNPTDRLLGRNWQFDESNIKTAYEFKALATTREIEMDDESIFDVENSNKSALKVHLDSSTIQYIKKKNKQTKEGYSNNSLKCYDLDENNKNIFCYSTFLDDLLENKPDSIKFIGPERISASENDDNERKLKSKESDYWVTWSEKSLGSEYQQYTSFGFDYQNGSVGPSWK